MELNNGEAREMRELQAQAHVSNQTFGFINSMTLKCAIELGIPDIIHNHGRPMTLPELASTLALPDARVEFLSRLMRMLTYSDFFAIQKVEQSSDGEVEGEKEGYVLTPPSQLLLKGSTMTTLPMVAFMLHPLMMQQFNCLSKWFHNDSPVTPFEMQHGRAYYDYISSDPELNRVMNEAMASDTPIVAGKIIQKCRKSFEQSTSMVDVGGGTGLLARGTADAFPNLELTVFDLPHVVHGLEGTKNLKFLAGDMFKYIPPANIILLKWILHNWNDEDCVKILKQCKEAVTSSGKHGGKVILVEMVIGDHNAGTDIELFLDMMMMACFMAKERTEREWAKLFVMAGFQGYKITPMLGLRSVIEVYP